MNILLAQQGDNAANTIQSQSHIDNLADVPGEIITVLIGLLPAVATLYLVLSGYRYMVAQGNPELVEKAKKSLLYAVFGVLISYAAAAVIYTVAQALGYNPRF